MSTPEFTLPTEPSWLARVNQRVADTVCGTEHKVRVRVQHQLPATFVYLCCSALLVFGLMEATVPRLMGLVLLVYVVLGQSTFYGLLRSGWSLRCRDPGLMLQQNIFALVAISISYAILGPIRGAPLILATQVLVYGMFSLTPRQALGLGAFTVALFGATMGTLSHFDPQGFPPDQERVRFMVLLVTLPTVSLCVYSVSKLRARLVQQKLELREALERAQRLATHDALTGLVNRTHMQELLEKERARQDRHGGAFSVALLDLDHFKRINDSHGHHAGDAVLQRFAALATEVLRETDVMARWGGEEFLVLFPATRAACAELGLQRLRERMAHEACVPQHAALRISVSGGLAEHRTDESMGQTLERADRALYQAKTNGRDQVRLAEPPIGEWDDGQASPKIVRLGGAQDAR
jgi:diguanylate cyclase (GGDEF)-like protein